MLKNNDPEDWDEDERPDNWPDEEDDWDDRSSWLEKEEDAAEDKDGFLGCGFEYVPGDPFW